VTSARGGALRIIEEVGVLPVVRFEDSGQGICNGGAPGSRTADVSGQSRKARDQRK
jgi:hypothetical protein